MKKVIIGLCLAGALAATSCKEEKKVTAETLKVEKNKISYALGQSMGVSFKKNKFDLDLDLIAQGIKEGFAGKALLKQEEMEQVLTKFQQQMMIKQQAELMKQAQETKKKGAEFLAKNKEKEGIVTLESGVQYKILTEGKGAKPTAENMVTANYEGRLIDGTVFDSSYKRGEPATFPVGGVIQGWQEILKLMPVGSKWQVFIPSELAYGERSPSPTIPGNSTLIFDIELLKVIQPEEAPAK